MRYRSGPEDYHFFKDTELQSDQLLSRANVLLSTTNADVTTNAEWCFGNAFGRSIVNGHSAAELMNPESELSVQAKENIQTTLETLLTECQDMIEHYYLAKHGIDATVPESFTPDNEPTLTDIVKKEFTLLQSETTPSIFASVIQAKLYQGDYLTRVYILADMHRETSLLYANNTLIHVDQNDIGISLPEVYTDVVNRIVEYDLPHIPLRSAVDLIESDESIPDEVLLGDLFKVYGDHIDVVTLQSVIEAMRRFIQIVHDAESFSQQFAPLSAEYSDVEEANRLIGILLAGRYNFL